MTAIKDILKTVLPEAEKIKNLLKDLYTSKITMDEFNKECAYWLISCDSLSPLMMPTRPYKLQEYNRMSDNDKYKVPHSFWRRPQIFKYIDQGNAVKGRNQGMLAKLIEYREYIPEQDEMTRSKYTVLINEHKL